MIFAETSHTRNAADVEIRDVSTRKRARYFVAGMEAFVGRARIIRCALTKPGIAASSGA
jgi:hypothetical protein